MSSKFTPRCGLNVFSVYPHACCSGRDPSTRFQSFPPLKPQSEGSVTTISGSYAVASESLSTPNLNVIVDCPGSVGIINIPQRSCWLDTPYVQITSDKKLFVRNNTGSGASSFLKVKTKCGVGSGGSGLQIKKHRMPAAAHNAIYHSDIRLSFSETLPFDISNQTPNGPAIKQHQATQ